MSSSFDERATPNALNRNAMRNMKIRAVMSPSAEAGRKPTISAIMKTMIPWAVATVAPPRVLPNIICERFTGATKVSLRKPNCLSQITSMPANIDVNRIDIAITPGTRKSMKLPCPARWKIGPKPNPRAIRNNRGCPSEPSILPLERQYLIS